MTIASIGSKAITHFELGLICLSNTRLMHLSELCRPHHNPNFSSRLFQEPRSRISTETFFSFSSQPTPTFPARLAREARRECGRGTLGANVGVPVFVFAPRKRAEAGLVWGLGEVVSAWTAAERRSNTRLHAKKVSHLFHFLTFPAYHAPRRRMMTSLSCLH
jgi:hypothetical protein